ncbi:MAG: sigma-54-dependent Fis family transcriptional regulator [Holophagales bacterium]|nr:sigma-54-dependent Fis family transcriptional regulator [Holophagales bacterium]
MSVRARVLLVEDRDSLRRMLARALEEAGHEAEAVDGVEAARGALAVGGFDLVLTDLMLPAGSGLDVLAAARAVDPALPVVVMTAYGTVSAAVEAMKLGATDFLEKPVSIDRLERLVAELVAKTPEAAVLQVPGAPPIVGAHPRLKAALRLLQRVAPTASTVLLTGASGTGKELFARALHALSPQASGPFVAVNCAAIPETLIENELFGHEKGAFTGADRRRPGRFELARGGTLFLDEIGELPLAVQAKVLRVLDGGGYERIGGGATLRAEVRIVAATNRDLAAMAEAGGFRRDLLFRLEIFPIALPALAERPSDLPLLARHLLESIAAKHGVAPPALSPEADGWLERAEWPGNVRQLANLLERAVILHPGERLGAAELEALARGGAVPAGPPDEERERLRAALLATNGDKRRAADALGWTYRTMLRRVRELDLEGYPKYRT